MRVLKRHKGPTERRQQTDVVTARSSYEPRAEEITESLGLPELRRSEEELH